MARPDRKPGTVPRIVLVLAVLALAAGPAASSEPPVSIDLGVAVASNDGTRIDPQLADLRAKLKAMFDYTSYRMVDRLKKSLAVGETGEFALPGGRTMRATPAPSTGGKVRLAVQIMEGQRNLLTTTLGLSRGGMVLVAGPAYQNGVLILIIEAH
ncbi:MAG: hypothetical protein ACM31I_04845 [Deltaproteobacteria bacterium]